jgi:hypothetical protein
LSAKMETAMRERDNSGRVLASDGNQASKAQTLKDAGIAVRTADHYEGLAEGKDKQKQDGERTPCFFPSMKKKRADRICASIPDEVARPQCRGSWEARKCTRNSNFRH